jgi:Family of unknown function (DUF6370)
MRIAALLLLGLGLTVALLGSANAEDKDAKEVTLKGTITCAKCDLGVAKKCATVIQVKKGADTTLYYFAPDSNKKYHGDTCKEAKAGTVTGTVTDSAGKKVITVSKVTYN